MIKFLIFSLLYVSTLSWNSNTCAWGAIGNNQPKNATECLGDQTNVVADCCYMKIKFPGVGDDKTFSLCSQLPKYLTNSATDEEHKQAAQKDAGTYYTVLEYTCRSSTPVKPDTRNVISPNTCAYDNLKFVAPNSKTDCTKDKDPSNFNKCCYVKSKWSGKENRSCSSMSKLTNLDDDAMKNVFKQMGGELEEIECAGNYLSLSLIMILLSLLVF